MKRACLVVILASARLMAQEALSANPQDIARGQKLFAGRCAGCHGPKGEGGRGSLLAQPTLTRATNDAALITIITKGIPGTEMPGAWDMIDKEIRWVAAYVHKLGEITPEPVRGNPSRGRELYLAKGKCDSCHTIRGEGGALGPDLTAVGGRRGATKLRQAVLDPASEVSGDFMPVHVALADGRGIDGVRINEDTFSIQMRDASGQNHSYWKSELRDVRKQLGKSVMPSYRGTFTDAEMDDLVAYLHSLRVR